ncbi:MAG: pyruvate kinase [Anaerolinea sp.]|nr:pyruvate kinase [Anaerolinea sp.]
MHLHPQERKQRAEPEDPVAVVFQGVEGAAEIGPQNFTLTSRLDPHYLASPPEESATAQDQGIPGQLTWPRLLHCPGVDSPGSGYPPVSRRGLRRHRPRAPRSRSVRRTKIVCTLGPASAHPAPLAAMIRAGMDVVRLNTSHGTMAEHLANIRLVRDVATAEGKPVGVLMDLSGPKLRTGETRDGKPIALDPGAVTRLTNLTVVGTAAAFTVDYPRLTEDVRTGDHVLLDDGEIELEVTNVTAAGLDCRVLVGGLLGPRKGVSFPNTNLTMPALTERDQESLRAGVHAGVDFFALSFVRDADDIIRARDLIHSLDADTPIIAKIERRQAVENLEAIMAEADGAMVARGDLGVELPPEDVPVQQRRIIASAGRNMIPVITATQMLESMVDSPRPTRAESSDVANAVWDLSDALMLSQETAVGRFPVETVAMMDRIIRRAEGAAPPAREMMISMAPETDDHSYVVALAARRIVESDPNMQAVVCFTRSGYTAFLLSKVHPNAPIFAITPNEAVCRRLSLARSVVPILAPLVNRSEEMLEVVDRLLTQGGHVAAGEEVVVVASMPVDAAGTTNFLKLHRVGESAEY